MDVESRKKLIDEIVENEGLYPGDKITYEKLLEMSDKYEIEPRVFAINILGVTPAAYQGVKSPSSNAKRMVILKDRIPQMIEDAINLRDIILEEEGLSIDSKISYKQLLEISAKYKVREAILAKYVFEISDSSFKQIKAHKEWKTHLFYKSRTKQSIIKDEGIEKFRRQIIESEGLRIGDKINYKTICELAEKYGISKEKLAIDVFGISKSAYEHIKFDSKRNTVILRNYMTGETLEKCKSKILDQEGLQPLDIINYEQLVEIANRNHINERILAVDILGISENQFYNMRYGQSKIAVILKEDLKKKSHKKLETIKKKIFKQKGLKEGDKISYEEIEELKKEYNLSLDELLYILGTRNNLIIEAYRKGVPIDEIGKRTGTFRTTIHEIIRKLNQEEREEIKKERKENKKKREEMRNYLEEQKRLFINGHEIDEDNIKRTRVVVKILGCKEQDINFWVRVYTKKELFMEAVQLLDDFANTWELSEKKRMRIVQTQNELRRKEIKTWCS